MIIDPPTSSDSKLACLAALPLIMEVTPMVASTYYTLHKKIMYLLVHVVEQSKLLISAYSKCFQTRHVQDNYNMLILTSL